MPPAAVVLPERYLERKLMAVLVTSLDLYAFPIQVSLARLQISLESRAVLGTKSFGHKHRQRLPHQLVTRISEYACRCAIDKPDDALFVDPDDGVRCGFGEEPITLF